MLLMFNRNPLKMSHNKFLLVKRMYFSPPSRTDSYIPVGNDPINLQDVLEIVSPLLCPHVFPTLGSGVVGELPVTFPGSPRSSLALCFL